MGPSCCVALFGHVGLFGSVEPCDCVSTLGSSSRVGLFDFVAVWDRLAL